MIRRLLEWLFPVLRIHRLLLRARAHGRVSLLETELAEGLGWTCSIRAPEPETEKARGRSTRNHKERYAWTGTGMALEEAIAAALEEADENPVMMKLEGIPFAPKLGGKAYDDE